ncbi:MAG: hypothetical protein HUU21_09355 [Polyangiaceae bacterium]|nr:hypothetical protein [Polyangiaceae bacterium]
MRFIPSLVVTATLFLSAHAALATPLEGKDAEKNAAPAPKTTPAPVGELAPIVPPRNVLPRVELHGGAYFWYYQPLSTTADVSPSDSNIELYLASLDFEGRLDDFGLVLNPRFRDSEAREFFTSNVWIEQAYAFYEKPSITVKLGKVYHQFSRLSDNTFYGNIPYFDGFKLDALYGLSLEGDFETESGFGLGYYGQYFLIDGGTNGSLRNRDTVWVEDDVHRNHTAVLRLEPAFRFNQLASLRFGLAGEHTYVDFTPRTGLEPQSVFRVAADLSFAYGPVRAFGEYMGQFGKTVTDYPYPRKPATTTPAEPGRSSGRNHYVMAGAEAQIWRITGRYSFSMVKYNDLDVTELLHLPGATVTLHDNVSLIVEYAYWRRLDPDKAATLDNSLNITVHARF